MFEQLQMMSGFKQIRSELADKCKIQKPLSELALWFSCTHGVLYVHNLENHLELLAIATKNDFINSEWTINLSIGQYGKTLIQRALEESPQFPHKYLNNQYRELGSLPFRLV